MTVCADCGRSTDYPECSCGRPQRTSWPVNHVGLGIGKGNAGALRGAQTGRPYMVSVRFSEDEIADVKRIAADAGHAVGRTIRELVREAVKRRAQLAELSRPGNHRPPSGNRPLRPVYEFGVFDR